MADRSKGLPPIGQLIREKNPDGARQVLHLYDFLCRYSYDGRQRNAIVEDHGFEVINTPFRPSEDSA
jgi:hypothetical protein